MDQEAETIGAIRKAAGSARPRKIRMEEVAGIIRSARGYRWVGIYDVGESEISVVAWSGPGEPAYPRFPVARGLCGDAVLRRETVIVNDVTKDPRYLTTFGSTRSEIVVPILEPPAGRAIGTLDVESEQTNAFTEKDRTFLERCSSEIGKFFAITGSGKNL